MNIIGKIQESDLMKIKASIILEIGNEKVLSTIQLPEQIKKKKDLTYTIL